MREKELIKNLELNSKRFENKYNYLILLNNKKDYSYSIKTSITFQDVEDTEVLIIRGIFVHKGRDHTLCIELTTIISFRCKTQNNIQT